MTDHLADDDAREVVATELLEDGGRRAALDEGIIDGIGQVGSHADGIDDGEDHLQDGLPEAALLARQRQEQQDHPQGIEVGNCREVEAQATAHDTTDVGPCERGEEVAVLKVEGQPHHHAARHEQQQVGCRGHVGVMAQLGCYLHCGADGVLAARRRSIRATMASGLMPRRQG